MLYDAHHAANANWFKFSAYACNTSYKYIGKWNLQWTFVYILQMLQSRYGLSASCLCGISMEHSFQKCYSIHFQKWLACISMYFGLLYTHTHTVTDTLSVPKINLCVKTLCIRWQINFQSFSISHTFSSVARFLKVDFPIEALELFAHLNFNVNGWCRSTGWLLFLFRFALFLAYATHTAFRMAVINHTCKNSE